MNAMAFKIHYRKYKGQMKYLIGNIKKSQEKTAKQELILVRIRMFDRMAGFPIASFSMRPVKL